jgi:hypothetical protein
MSKNFQLLDVRMDLKKFITKDKKTIEYLPSQIINNANSSLLNDMMRQKKECLNKTVNQDDCNYIEFI